MGLDASGTCRTVDGWDLREGAGDAKLRGEVRAGLSSPRPYLPSQLLGEALAPRTPFEEGTTATSGTEAAERRILERAAEPLARLRRAREMVLLDPGPALDAAPLVEALVDADALRRVLLLGVDRAGLLAAAGSISRRWNALSVRWLCCDPTEDLGVVGRARDRLVVLLGGRLSAIGPSSHRPCSRGSPGCWSPAAWPSSASGSPAPSYRSPPRAGSVAGRRTRGRSTSCAS